MKLIDSCLYLEFADCIDCGIKENTLKLASHRNSPSWTMIDDPADKRKKLIDYECLKDQYKEMVKARFGNPYDYLVKEPIRKMVSKDLAAEKYFLSYRYDDNKSLPIDTVNAYATAAAWLNMLVKAEADKKEIKKLLNISITEFFTKVTELIEQQQIKLPSNIVRLRQRIDDYKTDSYKSLIHKNFGNQCAAKIDDEVTESLLIELIAMPNADDPTTCRRYNMWAAENNKATISTATVSNWRRKNNYLISAQKYGNKPTYNTYGKHIIRSRPSAPLLLVENDDNDLDLYFQSRDTKKGVYYFNRFVIAIVSDAYNDYPLGWAIDTTYTKDLIRLAYLDAVHHVKELTGKWHLPHQIRSDRFGLDVKGNNDLGQFYQSLATFTPAKVGAPRGKYIEQSFGKKWHQVLGTYINYAGTNITSKTRINEDHRALMQKDFPTTEQAPAQIRQFINIMRTLVDEKTGMSKQEQWLKGYNESEKAKQHEITELQLLLKLGTRHQHKNKITNRGITPAINCIERTYEIPEQIYLQTIGATMQVIFDPMDYSRILVTNDNDVCFIAREMELMPSAIADYKPGDRARLNDRLNEKVRHMEYINSKKGERQNTLEINRINAAGMLQAGVHTKGINTQALRDYEVVYNNVPVKRIDDKKPFDPLDQL
jgi:hypothetical protein